MRLVDIDRVPVADELQEFANPCVVQLPRWAIEEIVRTCSAFPNICPCVEGPCHEMCTVKRMPTVIPAERDEDPSHPFADSVMRGDRSE